MTSASPEANDLEAERALLLAELRGGLAALTAERGAPAPRAVLAKLRKACAPLEVRAEPSAADPDPRAILSAWEREGPLVHEPTGFAGLDSATDGGPVYGSRWYILGAPDAGKTALQVQLAHEWAKRGIATGLLAVDEEPGDLLTRIAQRVGFSRHACEAREPATLSRLNLAIGALPLRLYDPTYTIERAGAELGAFAAKRKARCALFVDSIQTVRCDAELAAERELSEVQAIGLRVRSIRQVASEHRAIVIATSEMSRAAYRAINRSDNIDPLAAGKWSGAIEYSARVIVSLRSVKDSPDLIEVEVPKNKHGRRRYASEGDGLYLSIDRLRQTLAEAEAPAAPVEDEAAKAEALDTKVEAMAARILGALVKANAKGAQLTSRADLEALVKGDTNTKKAAVSLLRSTGRLEGGRGKPFAPAYPDLESEADE